MTEQEYCCERFKHEVELDELLMENAGKWFITKSVIVTDITHCPWCGAKL